MSIIKKIKSIGQVILGLGFFIGSIILLVLLLRGGIWIGGKVLPVFLTVSNIVAIISIFIFVPMAFFRKTRAWGGLALFGSSYLFGITLWIYSALVALAIWGFIGLFVGLLIFGIGVFLIALLATFFTGEWSILLSLIYMAVLTIGTRFLGLYIIEKAEEEPASFSNSEFKER